PPVGHRPEGQGQRRPADRGPGRTAHPHRGRLWPGGSADRCAERADHSQPDCPRLPPGGFSRRHSRRRRGHDPGDRRCAHGGLSAGSRRTPHAGAATAADLSHRVRRDAPGGRHLRPRAAGPPGARGADRRPAGFPAGPGWRWWRLWRRRIRRGRRRLWWWRCLRWLVEGDDMCLLSEEEQRQVAEAIARVERETDAELVTVLAARADDYHYIPLLWAGILALLL